MKQNSKAFTILELIIVIAIIAILAVIVIPNFVGAIEKSRSSRELAEINSVTKAAKLYYMENGHYPTLQGDQPTFGDPKNIRFSTDENGEGLYPKYLSNLPHFSYWIIDYSGNVYHLYDKIGVKSGSNSIKLDPKYNYSICNKSDNSVVQSNVTGTATLTPTQYLKIVDNNGNELPSLDITFDNLQEHPEAPEYKEATKDSATIVYNKDAVKNTTGNIVIANANTNMYDGDQNTSYSTYSMNVDVNISGVMINRAVNILYTGGTYGNITVIDSNGQKVPFYLIDTSINKAYYGEIYNMEGRGTKSTLRVIVPKNAAKIRILGSSSYSIQLYEIYTGTDNILPDSVSAVSCIQNEHSITFNWTKPKDSDFKQILVFRNGVHVGTSTAETFTDTTLLEDYSYNYTLIAQDNDGNASNRVDVTANTIRVGVVIRSTISQVCDGNDTTGIDMWGGKTEVTLENVDVEGQVLGVYAAFQWPNTITITDNNGQPLYFYAYDPSINTWKYTNSCDVATGVMTVKVAIPKNAYKLTVAQGGYSNHTNLYEIKEYNDDRKVPGSITNTSFTSTDISATLTWVNPSDADFSKIVIFRDKVYAGTSTTGKFIDNNLLENTSYTYTLIAVDTTGNISKTVTINAKTAKDGIVFRGVDSRAYDKNNTTYYPLNVSSQIDLTWDDNITGKTLTIVYWGGTYTYLKVLDASGASLTFTANGTSTTQLDMGGRTSCTVVIPEGAAKITMRAVNNGYNSGIYELAVN